MHEQLNRKAKRKVFILNYGKLKIDSMSQTGQQIPFHSFKMIRIIQFMHVTTDKACEKIWNEQLCNIIDDWTTKDDALNQQTQSTSKVIERS